MKRNEACRKPTQPMFWGIDNRPTLIIIAPCNAIFSRAIIELEIILLIFTQKMHKFICVKTKVFLFSAHFPTLMSRPICESNHENQQRYKITKRSHFIIWLEVFVAVAIVGSRFFHPFCSNLIFPTQIYTATDHMLAHI